MFPEPKTFNGGPGEVYGDDRRGVGGSSPKVRYVCDCLRAFTSLLTACEHVGATGHNVKPHPSSKAVPFGTAERKRA